MGRIEKLGKQRAILEKLYVEFHRPQFLSTDPLGLVRRYESPADREVVALIAASFAFGNFRALSRAIEAVLQPLEPNPAKALAKLKAKELERLYGGFVYRWVREEDVRLYCAWIGEALRRWGSLHNLWNSLDNPEEETILPALARFIEALTEQRVQMPMRRRIMKRSGGEELILPSGAHLLLTSPAGKSSCKRMNLFLRWVVRPDDGIDLGLWNVSASRLIMPVDTHVLQMSRAIGLTKRNAADLKTAEEITRRMRLICPEDPIKYDFSLVRPGMMRLKELITEVTKES